MEVGKAVDSYKKREKFIKSNSGRVYPQCAEIFGTWEGVMDFL